MFLLPELRTRRTSWTLSISTAGADQVAWGLLRAAPERLASFTEAISEEPGLALWIVCQADQFDRDCTVDDLARWLVEHGDEELAECSAADADAELVAKWAESTIASVTVAQTAALLSAKERRRKGPSTDPSFLLGLLHLAANCRADPGPPNGKSVLAAELLPDWLVAALREVDATGPVGGPAERVREAKRRLKLKPPGARQIKTVERRWKEPDRFELAAALPEIARMRHRIFMLEHRFGQQLEREKLASLRELAYGASHEINNPLANISTRAQTMLRDEQDPDRRKKLATISAQAFRAHEMISDMMLFAKPPEVSPSSVDVEQLINTVISELTPSAEEQGTSLQVRFDTGLDRIVADATQLAVAVKAMIQNSIEAIDLGGKVEVTVVSPTRSNEPSLEIVVADSGPGIATEVRPHLFDPFFSGREAGRGLGLGLSKAWRIVELHGGTIEVNDATLGGAQFTVRLPAEQPTCPRIRSVG